MEKLDYRDHTFGAFLQNSWKISDAWSAESGFRGDYQSDYGFFALPRLSLMFKPHNAITLRLGGGLGYKTPTIFTEDAERIQFNNILPIDVNTTRAEQSTGVNFDINYKHAWSADLNMSVNTLLFYTKIDDPLVLNLNGNGFYAFQQPEGYIDTKGIEVNLKLSYQDFKLFTGYTHAGVNQFQNEIRSDFPLVSKHRLNNVLMYEKEDNIWIGLEAYYYSPQKLGDGSTGESYWILGLMSEKRLGAKVSVFLNFENFLDTRQTRFDTIFTGSIDDPQFRDIYAPVDGFVVNGGLKIRIL
jgi:iron complex outermembrane receptor protein